METSVILFLSQVHRLTEVVICVRAAYLALDEGVVGPFGQLNGSFQQKSPLVWFGEGGHEGADRGLDSLLEKVCEGRKPLAAHPALRVENANSRHELSQFLNTRPLLPGKPTNTNTNTNSNILIYFYFTLIYNIENYSFIINQNKNTKIYLPIPEEKNNN